MKTKYFLMNLFLAAIFALLTSCGSENQKGKETEAGAEKVEKVNPIIIFENEFSKVVKVTLNPGEELAEHDGEDRLVYSLANYTIDWKEQGQWIGEKSWKIGDIHVHQKGMHAAKNSGSTQAEWIVFKRKTEELPDFKAQNLPKDINTAAGNFTKKIFDDDRFQVTEIKLPSNEAIPFHDGLNRIIYSLSDYTISYQSDKAEPYEKSFKKGDAHWHEAGKHALKNTGSNEVHFLVVAYK